jgi:hypothetical protein
MLKELKKPEFKIGDDVLLNGKEYKIVGTVKRSFKLERDGKFYKATANMMGKIKDQNSNGIGVGRKRKKRQPKSDTFYMEQRVARRRIFEPNVKMPETNDELLDALDTLCAELSPENLSCDGELSRTAINQRLRAIRGEWKEIEKKLGRKVSEDEIEERWLTKYRNR